MVSTIGFSMEAYMVISDCKVEILSARAVQMTLCRCSA